MTITLHWWMVPVAIVAFGFVIAGLHKDQSGFMPDMTGPLVIVASILVAAAITLGHFL
jgi:hypothetical protein